MKYRPIGSSGMQASTIILGTWATGGFQWGGTDAQESIRAIHAAMDEGINTIDTAPVYGFGESEIRVGKAVKGRRDRVLLATKCGVVWHIEKGQFFFSADDHGPTQDGSGRKVYRYLHPQSIRYEIEQSLHRLSTDYIDLYQVHWMDDTTPIPEIMNVLLELKKEGKIRAIGVSNATVEHLEQYRAEDVIDSDQERYSLFDREIEKKNIRYCTNHAMSFIAYSPLFHGLLTGRMTGKTRFGQGDIRSTRLRFAPDYIEKVNQMLLRLDPIVASHQTTTTRLVLAYMLRQPGCTHVVVGARKVAHACENAKAADVDLSAEQIHTMNQIFSDYLPRLSTETTAVKNKDPSVA
jgi:aryl-alcohol dehydrogenase-like predicted oxidoreductase